MNNRQKREVIFACCMGDACIYKSKINTFSLIIQHGESQIDYLQWKANLLNSISISDLKAEPKRKTTLFNGKTFIEYMCSWHNTKKLRIYHKWLYNGKNKTVRKVLKYLSSPFALAIWFMDDGSVFKRKRKHKDGTEYYLRPSLKLCTHSFSQADNKVIQQWLKDNFDIESYVVIERKRNREGSPEYYTLNFNADETLKIWNLIKEYVVKIESMRKKFGFLIDYYS